VLFRSRTGYVASGCVGVILHTFGHDLVTSLGAMLGCVLFTRVAVYSYFERFLALKALDDFKSDRIRHLCVACGASCRLRVNLAADDAERILNHATQSKIEGPVIEKRGKKMWLKRKRDGTCLFLTCSEDLPRCSIYPIRPVACRLYPLIPVGTSLKMDPLCPGLARNRGHTFREHLQTQEIGAYVRKMVGSV
jgi:Fe-S-cluster containining protein